MFSWSVVWLGLPCLVRVLSSGSRFPMARRTFLGSLLLPPVCPVGSLNPMVPILSVVQVLIVSCLLLVSIPFRMTWAQHMFCVGTGLGLLVFVFGWAFAWAFASVGAAFSELPGSGVLYVAVLPSGGVARGLVSGCLCGSFVFLVIFGSVPFVQFHSGRVFSLFLRSVFVFPDPSSARWLLGLLLLVPGFVFVLVHDGSRLVLWALIQAYSLFLLSRSSLSFLLGYWLCWVRYVLSSS